MTRHNLYICVQKLPEHFEPRWSPEKVRRGESAKQTHARTIFFGFCTELNGRSDDIFFLQKLRISLLHDFCKHLLLSLIWIASCFSFLTFAIVQKQKANQSC
jgi:hypothetical protein